MPRYRFCFRLRIKGDGSVSDEQSTLFGGDEQFNRAFQEWGGMPDFSQEDMTPYAVVLVQFRNREDMEAFSRLVEQPVERHRQTRAIWFPRMDIARFADQRWRSGE